MLRGKKLIPANDSGWRHLLSLDVTAESWNRNFKVLSGLANGKFRIGDIAKHIFLREVLFFQDVLA